MAIEVEYWYHVDVLYGFDYKLRMPVFFFSEDGPHATPVALAEKRAAEEFSKARPEISHFKLWNPRWETIYVRVSDIEGEKG